MVLQKGRRIIIPAALQDRELKHLQLNHMVKEKTQLLAHESIYWININTDIEEMKKLPHKPGFSSNTTKGEGNVM